MSQVLGARPIASLRDVTAADVRSVAERYLVPERRCVVTPATEPASK